MYSEATAQRLRAPAVAAAAATPLSAAGATGLLAVFAVTLFASAALMFTVEPMVGKLVLPWLGGSPAVWNTCVMFFQACMLAGYGYAHLVARQRRLVPQCLVHVLLLGAAALALPIVLRGDWLPPATGTPVFWLLGVLATSVGLPFFAISATAPLLQSWFSRTTHPSAHDPYFLYAASNAGSLAALLAYPLVIEPSASLTQQNEVWTATYLLLVGLTILSAAAARLAAPAAPDARPAPAVETAEAPPTWRERGRWLALTAVPSSLLLGVTTYLSTDVAAMPLLWAIPLALYLLSFVLAFLPRAVVPQTVVLRALVLLVLPLVLAMAAGAGGPLVLVVPLHLTVFFLCALQLHTQLAAARPPVRSLTGFYGWVALGGLLGGIVNTLLAPLAFTGVAEYPAALVAACALCAWPGATRERPGLRDIVVPAGVGVVVAGAALAGATGQDPRLTMVLMAPAVLWCFSFSRRPVRFAAGVAMLFLGAQLGSSTDGALLHEERSFFGTLRVREDARAQQHTLWHGTTIHGAQNTSADRRDEPLTYYHRRGPIGQLFEAKTADWEGANIGVIGLGVGSLAEYAAPAQRWTFYEIDAAVERIARDDRLFTHLAGCNACDVRLGDARLSLASRTGVVHDLIVIDAFSSDAIPVHLLTREALDVYWRRLAENGVLAFHISNRHLALQPVLATLAAAHGAAALAQRHQMDPADAGGSSSEWFLMARSDAAFGPLTGDDRWQRPVAPDDARVWTDDYSNVLGVVKSWGVTP